MIKENEFENENKESSEGKERNENKELDESKESSENKETKENCYVLTLNSNHLVFDVCINQEDLLGEPAVGRRFKGTIWMQGQINYQM